MVTGARDWLSRFARLRGGARDWAAVARTKGLGAAELRQLRDEARSLQSDLRGFLRATSPASSRSRAALAALRLPAGTDWRWRAPFFVDASTIAGHAAPVSGARMGGDLAIWHDCPTRSLIVRQTANRNMPDLAPYGLRVEVLGFGGTYLSLSIDLPTEACTGLSGDYILRVEMNIVTERVQPAYGRLNLKHGPNTDPIVAAIGGLQPGAAGRTVVEFDLSRTLSGNVPPEKIWLDLILEAPLMNLVDIRDLILSRHPRAEV